MEPLNNKDMKTKKQKQLINERKYIKEKNAELLKRLEDLISLAENEKRDFTEEENKTSNFLNGYMNANNRRLKEIDDKLAVYEVMEDCIDGFIKQLKKEFDIKSIDAVCAINSRMNQIDEYLKKLGITEE